MPTESKKRTVFLGIFEKLNTDVFKTELCLPIASSSLAPGKTHFTRKNPKGHVFDHINV